MDAIKTRGETGKANALIGKVMKETRGKARPDVVRKMIYERLGVEE